MSDPRPVIVVGAGGHGRVAAEALRLSGVAVLGFVDPRGRPGDTLDGLPVLGGDAALADHPDCDLVNGVGGTGLARTRRQVQDRLEAQGRRFVGCRHPSAVVSPSARLAPDVQVMAGAIVQAGADLAAGVIVNTRAVVEHDCRIGGFGHCAPGSVVCGDVRLGRDVHVGAGAVIRQGLTLEDGAVVGAGAVVIAVPPGPGLLAGVPAVRKP